MAFLAGLTGAEVLGKGLCPGFPQATPELFYQKITQRLLKVQSQTDILTHLPALHRPEEDKKFAEAFFLKRHLAGRKTVFMNPYRASKQTGWGIDKYISVGKALTDCGVRIIMHEKGGPDEHLGEGGIRDKDQVQTLRTQLAKAGVILAGSISVRELIALIGKCDMLLGEPSGPCWLAAAMGKPTVTIAPSRAASLASFLPPPQTGFQGSTPKHTVILNAKLAPPTEDRVVELVLEKLGTCVSPDIETITDLPLRDQTTTVLEGRVYCT